MGGWRAGGLGGWGAGGLALRFESFYLENSLEVLQKATREVTSWPRNPTPRCFTTEMEACAHIEPRRWTFPSNINYKEALKAETTQRSTSR